MKNAAFVLAILLPLSSCTYTALEPEGDKVEIVDTITATDLLSYERVGHLGSLGMANQEYCRNDLRNQAAKLGAQIVRITSSEPAYCALDGLGDNKPKNCFTAYGDAYRRKTAPATAP